LADDQPAILESIRRLLEPEIEIVGEARDGLELLAAAERTKPDIIIADITMPRLDGIEAVRRIKRIAGDIRIVFLTMHPDAVYATAALNAGGSAFVLKSSAGDELLPAIHAAMQGRRFITPAVVIRDLQAKPHRATCRKKEFECLTGRQKEVLQLLAKGKTPHEIAAALSISPITVRSHKRDLMRELQLRTTAELIRYAKAHVDVIA
jgi:DNA-binding NarL/FixJ family response regulator